MRLILLRHGESEGNVDETLFCSVPDHAMVLTDRGREQSERAGIRLGEVIGDDPIDVYVSPYRRTWQTWELLGLQDRTRRIREEPRLREQDWGNLQDPAWQQAQKAERNSFGHFYYRLRSGESGADVFDRLSGFFDGLLGPHAVWPRGADGTGYRPGETVVLVTHGLAMRLACMALMGWTVEQFESLSNPGNGDFRIVTRHRDGWELDRPFDTWR
ncbi:histidine phosphatase family protein [Nakamurella sp. YIM 132087]|uniref:Histidine phosphatase family protein n=1 Tax=Nakamurella alba TaxID=2665158 RepID=A0A7K1FGG8_9ACTN|nr:histidine phosphatase family protein [Nakamurella alba]MTD12579.1 histidine phosphatase family protein [Nakamurella alba]